jgi:hypothetical protein
MRLPDRARDPRASVGGEIDVAALVSGATGALLAIAAGGLEPVLQVPATLLRIAGLALLPYAVVVARLARRDVLPRGMVWAAIGCNALWAIDCVALLFTGWVDPSLTDTVH